MTDESGVVAPAADRMDLSGRGVRRARAIEGPQAGAYAPHALHGAESCWLEKNCYIDIWLEVLHALGLDPHAIWPFTVAIDFEGDQWTFFKPPHGELRALYGIDVQELTVWRPLAEHAIEHLGAGRALSVEADSFWLPDTAGTDYRQNHVKTTIVLNEVDLDAPRVGYFHSAGYHEALGEDAARLLGPHADAAPAAPSRAELPLYAEFIRTTHRVARSNEELRMLALHHLATHLAFRPASNPVRRFAARLADDLPLLRERGLPYYHQWAFGTIRQLGAAFEFAARGLAWHGAPAGAPLDVAAGAFDRIARDAKTLILKGARAVSSSRPTDLSPLVDGIAQAWDEGMAALDTACCGARR